MQHTDILDDDDDTPTGMIAELKQRVDGARAELDQRVAEHPFMMVAGAFVLGAVLALGPPKGRAPDAERTLGGVVFAGLAALAIRGAKAYAWSRVSTVFDARARRANVTR